MKKKLPEGLTSRMASLADLVRIWRRSFPFTTWESPHSPWNGSRMNTTCLDFRLIRASVW
jgi:hypothetical protein